MTPIRKAALKTAIVFVSAFVLVTGWVELFNLNHVLFEPFLFKPEFYESPDWLYLPSLIILASANLIAILGYLIAKRKNRNACNWAGLCESGVGPQELIDVELIIANSAL